jgi:hypothetical protein
MKKILFIALGCLSLELTYAQNTSFKIRSAPIVSSNKTDNIYKTIDVIDLNYANKELESKEKEYNDIIDGLYQNSIGKPSLGYVKFKKVKIDAEKAKAEVLLKDIEALKVKVNEYEYLYTQDYLSMKRFSLFSFGVLRSRAFFDMLYGTSGKKRFQALGNAGFNFGDRSGSIYSEIVNGNLGLLRVSLGAMVSANSNSNTIESKKDEAYQRLVSTGGNTVLNFEYPLMYAHSRDNQYNLVSRLLAKGTADMPAFGTSTDKWAGSGSIGFDLYGDASLSNNELRFFFNLSANQVYGTDIFQKNLGTLKNKFTFGQLSVGLVFLQNFKISVMVATFSSEGTLENRNPILGGQVLK